MEACGLPHSSPGRNGWYSARTSYPQLVELGLRRLLLRGPCCPAIGEVSVQHRCNTKWTQPTSAAHLTLGGMRFGRGRWGQTPRVGLEPTTLRLTAGCSAN